MKHCGFPGRRTRRRHDHAASVAAQIIYVGMKSKGYELTGTYTSMRAGMLRGARLHQKLSHRKLQSIWSQGAVVCRFKNNSKEGYAVGGSGTLLKTEDLGQSWKRDRSTDGVAGNLYAVKFTPGGNGFILGNDGILLRFIG